MRPLLLLAALSALLSNACYPPGDGKAPPLEELYFPTGVALDGFTESEVEPGAPKFLYVANSDFDLQYRAASVISYDLDLLRQVVPRNCNKTEDCQRDGGDDFCDSGEGTDPARGPSYYCVKKSDPRPCGEFGNHDDADLVITPGRCNWVNPITPQDGTPSLKVDTVGIGAFATDVLWRKNPDADPNDPRLESEPEQVTTSRLFIPVRGDSTLHWIDVDGIGHFHCGQENGENDDGCDSKHRAGDIVWDNYDQLRQPPEPFALDASPNGKFIALTNQTSGSVSLFANDWRPDVGGPMLMNILSGLPLAPVGIAALPESALGDAEKDAAFLVTYRTAAQIDLLRVHTDAPVAIPDDPDGNSYTRSTLRPAGSVPINSQSLGFDSRGIVIDDTEGAACEAEFAQCGNDPTTPVTKCQADRVACHAAARLPEVFVASRAPASLLVGAMTADVNAPTGTSWLPSFTDSLQLTFGPSRVIAGQIKVRGTASSAQSDSAGPYELERRIFVVCFDSRRIFVYDPKRRLFDATVSTGRGPFALAVDPIRGLAYLGHFTDSYLGVISLDQRFPKTYATIVASIGAPKAPRTSK